MAPLANFTRTTRHVMNGLSNRDSVGCGSEAAQFTLRLASELPAGWAFAATRWSGHNGECTDTNYCSKAGFMALGGELSFGIPDDAAEGDYDFCVAATNDASGLMAAKVLRVSLPESRYEGWWTNNRPAYYTNVDPALQASCDALNGACAPGRADCEPPVGDENCVVDLPCPAAEDGDFSGWGYCWGGERSRGLLLGSVTQSFCLDGPPLLESESCASLKPPCADQATCVKPTTEWAELKTDKGENAMCNPAWTGVCKDGQPGVGTPLCENFYGHGSAIQGWGDTPGFECWKPLPPFPEPGWDQPKEMDFACARRLCEASDVCGGYMTQLGSYHDFYFYGTQISAGMHNTHNQHECWQKPAPASEATCECVGGPLVRSTGCSNHYLDLPDQWVGPRCDQA